MRLASLRPRVRSLSSSSAPLRSFSTDVSGYAQHVAFYISPKQIDEPRQNALLGPSFRFPFPGDIASSFQRHHENEAEEQSVIPDFPPLPSTSLSQLTTPANSVGSSLSELLFQLQNAELGHAVQVELSAHACPKLLQKDMSRLFPGLDVHPSSVNVINVSQKTENDQRAWTKQMETEREALSASFISAATSVCSLLQRCGHWADFIDPCSGRPFLGKFTNATLFETDDAYRQMGFRIEDLGCCKVLMHAMWGSHAFVGTIFTNAPIDSRILSDILRKANA